MRERTSIRTISGQYFWVHIFKDGTESEPSKPFPNVEEATTDALTTWPQHQIDVDIP